VRPGDRDLAQRLKRSCSPFIVASTLFPESAILRDEQMVESIRRVKYVSVIRTRDVSYRRADPNGQLFDPLKEAILQQRRESIDEAFWFVFLFVHFGKHGRAGWRYAREVYGCIGG